MSASNPTREENIARAKFEGGISKDTDKGNFKDRNHKYGYMAVSMEGLDLGKPWRASEDPNHDCKAMGCKIGQHYFRPNGKAPERDSGPQSGSPSVDEPTGISA